MSLAHAILGFLNDGPLSGYDLKSKFDASVRHFWPADQSQIYRTLSRLAEQGHAEIEVVEQEVRPDRKVYHITDSGREELHRWLASDLPVGGQRIAALVQIYFAGKLTDEEILRMLRGLAGKMRAGLDQLKAVRVGIRPAECAVTRDSFFRPLTLDYGITITQANLDWLEGVIDKVERGEHVKGARQ